MFNKAKKVLTKLLTFSFVACCTIGLTMGIAGCDDDNNNDTGNNTAVVSVKDVKQEDGKLIITYSDGTTTTIPVSTAACNHENTEKVRILGSFEGLVGDEEDVEEWMEYMGITWTHHDCCFLNICTDCGKAEVVEDEAAHVIAKMEATCTEASKEACIWCGYEVPGTESDAALGHELATKFSVEDDEVLCGEDGGFAITYCTREDCGHVESAEIVKIGHHSSKWTLTKKPTATMKGELTGVCDACDVTVNGVHFDGCGKTVTIEIPELSLEDYTLKAEKTGDCSQNGQETYSYIAEAGTKYEQEITFEVDVLGGDHTIGLKDGTTTKIETNKLIYTDEDYTDWTVVNNKTIECKKEEGVQAIFTCKECGTTVSVYVAKRHTKPTDLTKITFTPASDNINGKDVYSGPCDVDGCSGIWEEEVAHDLRYEMKKENDGSYTLITTCANKHGDDTCGLKVYKYNLTNVQEDIIKDSTCDEEGTIRYTYVDGGLTVTLDGTIDKKPHLFKGVEYYANQRVEYTADCGIIVVNNATVTCNNAVTGIFDCENEGCTQTAVGVILYVPHTVKEGTYVAPTCEADGSYECDKGCGTIGAAMDASLKALGHDLVYTITSETTEEKYVISQECQREDCTTDLSTIEVLKANSDYEEPKTANCQAEGVWKITEYTGSTKTEVKAIYSGVLAKTGHTLIYKTEKTEIVVDEYKTYEYNSATMTIIDNDSDLSGCDEGTPDAPAKGVQAIFTCEDCNYIACSIYVRLPHTKPETVTTEAPTCEDQGYDYGDCPKCENGEWQGNFVAALTHDWKYDINESGNVLPTATATGSLTLTCKNYSATNNKCTVENGTKTVTLPRLSQQYKIVSGVVTYVDADGTPVYTSKTVTAECGVAPGVEYTMAADVMVYLGLAKTKELAEANLLTFTVTEGTELSHDYTTTLTWYVAEEVTVGSGDDAVQVTKYRRYTGSYCERCEKIIYAQAWSLVDELPEGATLAK